MRDFHIPGRSAVIAANGVCATSHPLAAQVAVDTLRTGGNAVDAAIAGAMTLNVCEPHMCGLGGDCFALVKPAGREDVIALNGSGPAPAGLSAQALRERGLDSVPLHTVDAVTMPGAVDAIVRLSEDWGRAGLGDSLAPAIRYADEGVPVAPRVAADWAAEAATLQGAARAHFLHGDRPPARGQIFRAPGLAEVLRHIAREGRAGFYDGIVAEDMLESLGALGGCHTADDLAAVRTSHATPVRSHYNGAELIEHPPNGQGATANLLLNILSHFELGALDPAGAERAHIEAEATKLAYDARDRIIADANHTTRLEHMLAPETAAALAGLIDRRRALPHPPRAAGAVHRDTVYITVVDRDRMAVSLIFSIFHAFGTGLASDRFGILFQNRGAGFTLEPGHPNEAGGGKRPMHTIIPAMLGQGGHVTTPFGVMGGAYQACGHARFVSNMRDFEMEPQEAIDAPRTFAEGDTLWAERGYAPQTLQALEDLGHSVRMRHAPLGGGQAIVIDNARGTLEGASDPRKDGCAIGY